MQVLYNLFDSYLTLGPERIDTIDVLSGFASFAVVAVGGSAIGIIWGFLTGFITRFSNKVLLIEPAFIFIMSYLAYISAEAFNMSGILSQVPIYCTRLARVLQLIAILEILLGSCFAASR